MAGSLDARLSEVQTEIKHFSEALEDEVQERRRDHDEIVKLREWAKTIFNKIEDLKKEVSGGDDAIKRLMEEKLKPLTSWQENFDKAEKATFLNEKKETRERRWKVWEIIIGAILGAVITGLIGGWISLKLFGKVP